jgi:hypothetical protein
VQLEVFIGYIYLCVLILPEDNLQRYEFAGKKTR